MIVLYWLIIKGPFTNWPFTCCAIEARPKAPPPLRPLCRRRAALAPPLRITKKQVHETIILIKPLYQGDVQHPPPSKKKKWCIANPAWCCSNWFRHGTSLVTSIQATWRGSEPQRILKRKWYLVPRSEDWDEGKQDNNKPTNHRDTVCEVCGYCQFHDAIMWWLDRSTFVTSQ